MDNSTLLLLPLPHPVPLPVPGAGRHTFDASQPTLFTVEGLIYYLPQAAVQQLFGSLLQMAAPGSRVAFDFLHQQVRAAVSNRLPTLLSYRAVIHVDGILQQRQASNCTAQMFYLCGGVVVAASYVASKVHQVTML